MRFRKLYGRITEVFGTQKAFAAALGMNVCTLSFKLRDKNDWTRQEMARACDLLGIPLSELHLYFFAD